MRRAKHVRFSCPLPEPAERSQNPAKPYRDPIKILPNPIIFLPIPAEKLILGSADPTKKQRNINLLSSFDTIRPPAPAFASAQRTKAGSSRSPKCLRSGRWRPTRRKCRRGAGTLGFARGICGPAEMMLEQTPDRRASVLAGSNNTWPGR